MKCEHNRSSEQLARHSKVTLELVRKIERYRKCSRGLLLNSYDKSDIVTSAHRNFKPEYLVEWKAPSRKVRNLPYTKTSRAIVVFGTLRMSFQKTSSKRKEA